MTFQEEEMAEAALFELYVKEIESDNEESECCTLKEKNFFVPASNVP